MSAATALHPFHPEFPGGTTMCGIASSRPNAIAFVLALAAIPAGALAVQPQVAAGPGYAVALQGDGTAVQWTTTQSRDRAASLRASGRCGGGS